MSVEQTLSIIKPDGVQKNLIGEIVGRFEKAGLQIVAAKMLHLSKQQAEGFYAVHKQRPFFDDLISYMTSGPVVVHKSGRTQTYELLSHSGGEDRKGVCT